MKIFYILLLAPLYMFAQERVTVEQLFNVQTVKVIEKERQKSYKNYGYVLKDESRVYKVVPRFSGYVTKLYATQSYMKVKKGDPLVEVYAPEVSQAKDEYINSYHYNLKQKNQAMLESAKRKLQYLGVPDKEIKALIKNPKSAATTTIYAPASGYIFVKNITHGSAFKAKQELFEIVNLDQVWVEAKIYPKQQLDFQSIEHFEVKSKAITLKTKKAELLPELDPKIATQNLRLTLKNRPNRLIPGMYVTVFSMQKAQRYKIIPRTAAIRKNGRYYAFIVGEYEGEYEPVEIEVKALDKDHYEVLSGLSVGEEVVNNALFMMDSDAQINGLY